MNIVVSCVPRDTATMPEKARPIGVVVSIIG